MGLINTVQCQLVIDTGANVTIVRTDVARQAKGEVLYTASSVSLRTVTGDEVAVHGRMKVSITIGASSYQHIVYMADITDPCILGLDFLKNNKFELDFRNNEMHVADEDIPLFGLAGEVHNCRIVTKEDITISPRSERIINGKVKGPMNFRLAVTDFPSTENNIRGILVAASLVDITKDTVPVRVANISDKPKIIRKGEQLASCVPVTSVMYDCRKTSLHQSDYLKDLKEDLGGLNSAQKDAAEKLIEEFREIFSSSSSDVGHTKLTQHRIDTGAHAAIKQAPRRLPFAKREEVAGLLNEMESNNVVEPSASPWASPIVLVKKKDGSTRFCVDYRKLNSITKKDSYPLPRIDDTLDTLSGSQWFSTLDLKSGYWQVEIHPDDKEKTAFTTGQGLYQFKVMPFGLCNAPATFERLMETVLRGLSCEACLVYLDDIIIIGRSFEEHLQNLRQVFDRLRNANLKLNPTKCKLFRKEVNYLGHIISVDGVRTDPDKTKAVEGWCRPQDVHQLRSFLGLCTYYRRFVKNFSNIARPLHRLTESDRPFDWTDECEEAFRTLKQKLTTTPVLVYPQPLRPFILDTDASNDGIGAVLSQEIDGEERVIAYFSKTLSRAERNYCVTRKELLAMVKAVEHFHHYLYGRKFLLRTDHAALSWLLNFKNPEGQVARWLQRLQEYEMDVRHRKGTAHGNADALSRRPCPQTCSYCSRAETNFSSKTEETIRQVNSDECSQPVIDIWSNEGVRKAQEEDPDIGPVLILKEKSDVQPEWQEISPYSPTTKHYWALWDSLTLQNGVLYRKWENDDGKGFRLQLLLPRSRIPDVMKEIHNSAAGGHFGMMKTLSKVRERFFWNNARTDVERWCRECTECMARKGPKKRTRGKLKRYNVGAPFERIALDVLGPLPRTLDGNKYILVLMDYFTKWPEAYAIPDQEAKTICDVLTRNWICRYGVPLLIHSDQGRNFESDIFQGVCKILGMEKTRTTALHPQSDGMVERLNRTILNHLSIFVSKKQEDWDQHLPLFLLAYRSATHESTRFPPSRMLFGRDLRLPCDLLFGRPSETPSSPERYVQDLQARLLEVHHFARERINIASDRMKTRYDSNANERIFKDGDKVWFFNPRRRRGLCPKLQQNWEGPYLVVKRLNSLVYRIQKSPSSKPRVVHVDRLAPYKDSQDTARDVQPLRGGQCNNHS